MARVLRAAILIVFGLSLSGCMIFGDSADRALRKTPSYKQGYQDGCAAANNPSANPREDPQVDKSLYETDKVYRRGWANGYQMCKPSQPAPGDRPYDPLHGTIPGR